MNIPAELLEAAFDFSSPEEVRYAALKQIRDLQKDAYLEQTSSSGVTDISLLGTEDQLDFVYSLIVQTQDYSDYRDYLDLELQSRFDELKDQLHSTIEDPELLESGKIDPFGQYFTASIGLSFVKTFQTTFGLQAGELQTAYDDRLTKYSVFAGIAMTGQYAASIEGEDLPGDLMAAAFALYGVSSLPLLGSIQGTEGSTFKAVSGTLAASGSLVGSVIGLASTILARAEADTDSEELAADLQALRFSLYTAGSATYTVSTIPSLVNKLGALGGVVGTATNALYMLATALDRGYSLHETLNDEEATLQQKVAASLDLALAVGLPYSAITGFSFSAPLVAQETARLRSKLLELQVYESEDTGVAFDGDQRAGDVLLANAIVDAIPVINIAFSILEPVGLGALASRAVYEDIVADYGSVEKFIEEGLEARNRWHAYENVENAQAIMDALEVESVALINSTTTADLGTHILDLVDYIGSSEELDQIATFINRYNAEGQVPDIKKVDTTSFSNRVHLDISAGVNSQYVDALRHVAALETEAKVSDSGKHDQITELAVIKDRSFHITDNGETDTIIDIGEFVITDPNDTTKGIFLDMGAGDDHVTMSAAKIQLDGGGGAGETNWADYSKLVSDSGHGITVQSHNGLDINTGEMEHRHTKVFKSGTYSYETWNVSQEVVDNGKGSNTVDVIEFGTVSRHLFVQDDLYNVIGVRGTNYDDYFQSYELDNVADIFDGGKGNDEIYAGGGDDLIIGGLGDDTLSGGEGDDVFHQNMDFERDIIDGGEGFDIIDYSVVKDPDQYTDDHGFGIKAYLEGNNGNYAQYVLKAWYYSTNGIPGIVDQIYGVEGIIGTSIQDYMYGDDGDNYFSGKAGVDSLYGNGGNDTILGGTGDDVLYGGSGKDLFIQNMHWEYDVIDGGADFDVVDYSQINDPEGYLAHHDFGIQVYLDGRNNAFDPHVLKAWYSSTDGIPGIVDKVFNIEGAVGTKMRDLFFGTDGDNYFDGQDGDDEFSGHGGKDTIFGGDGDDTIHGDGGKDVLEGGNGEDQLYGGDQDDVLYGGDGQDTLDGGKGEDYLEGGLGVDVLIGGDDNDVLIDISYEGNTLYGGKGQDLLKTGVGDDFLYGGAGDDLLFGNKGDDNLFGGDGEDVFYQNMDFERDTIDGGDGFDIIDYSVVKDPDQFTDDHGFGVKAYLDGNNGNYAQHVLKAAYYSTSGIPGIVDQISHVEGIIGTSIKDYMYGDDGNNYFSGKADADVLHGNGGDDTILGGTGDDLLYGGTGNDLFIQNMHWEYDVIDGGADFDIVDYSQINDPEGYLAHHDFGIQVHLDGKDYTYDPHVLKGWYYSTDGIPGIVDKVFNIEGAVGTKMRDLFFGTDGDNYFDGQDGDDELVGRGGQDVLVGGSGNDTLDGGMGEDLFRQELSADNDIIIGGDDLDAVDYSTASAINGLDLAWGIQADLTTGTVTKNGNGEVGTDSLTGIERIAGSRFRDSIIGDDGDNHIHGREGDDTLIGAGGRDVLLGGGDNDFLSGGEGEDILTGGVGNDTLLGDGGADVLLGGAGRDTMRGGAGDDVFRQELSSAGDVIEGGSGFNTIDYGSVESEDAPTLDWGVVAELSLGQIRKNGVDGKTIDVVHGVEGLVGTYLKDVLGGGSAANVLSAGDGDDTIFGLDGEDIILGGLGDDVIYGGNQDDLIYQNINNESDYIDGGAGFDVVDYNHLYSYFNEARNGLIVDMRSGSVIKHLLAGTALDTILNIEGVVGSRGNDILIGDDVGNMILGGIGNDTLSGGRGDDEISGGAGLDVIYQDFYFENDHITGGQGNDILNYHENIDGEVNDLVLGAGSVDAVDMDGLGLWVNLKSKEIIKQHNDGDAVDEVSDIFGVIGTNVSDYMIGNDWGNFLSGMEGADTLIGGRGSDELDGGSGADVIVQTVGFDEDVIRGGEGTDILDYSMHNQTFYLADNYGKGIVVVGAVGTVVKNHVLGQSSDTITGFEHLIGTQLDDTLSIGGGLKILDGHKGNDILIGGDQVETLFGGEGDDTLKGRGGSDILVGGAGNDRFVFGYDERVVYLDGERYEDQIHGGEGFDTVDYSEVGQLANNSMNFADRLVVDLDAGTVTRNNMDWIDSVFSDVSTIDHISGIEGVIGGNNADWMSGDQVDNYFVGLKGVDYLEGGFGSDTLIGGEGADFLSGGADSDELQGGESTDVLIGGTGDDFLNGGDADDWFFQGFAYESDEIHGGSGSDTIDYSTHWHYLSQVFVRHSLRWDGFSATPESYLEGLAAEKDLDGMGLVVDLSEGFVTKRHNNGDISDIVTGIEHVIGTVWDDVMTGSARGNSLFGGDGNDELAGGRGDDELIGGNGNDIFHQDFNYESDVIWGGQKGGWIDDTGTNMLTYSLPLDSSYQDEDGLGIVADLKDGMVIKKHNNGDAVDRVYAITHFHGSQLDDEITGDYETRILAGGLGDDVLRALNNNVIFHQGFNYESDHFYGNASTSFNTTTVLDYSAEGDIVGDVDGIGIDVNLQTGIITKHHNDGDINDFAVNVGTVIGTNLDDVIRGHNGANKLYGMSGNDTLTGGLPSLTKDSLYGGDGDDVLVVVEPEHHGVLLVGGAGHDVMDFSALTGNLGIKVDLSQSGVDSYGYSSFYPHYAEFSEIEGVIGTGRADFLIDADGDNLIAGGAGNDIIFGGAGADTLSGGAGHDSIVQSLSRGGDVIDGGDGNDTLTYDAADYVDADGLGVVADLARGEVIKKHNDGDFIDTVSGIESLIGSSLNDTLRGGYSTETLIGGLGDDEIYTRGGGDIVRQGFDYESDTITGDAALDEEERLWTTLDYNMLFDLHNPVSAAFDFNEYEYHGLTADLQAGTVIKNHEAGEIADYVSNIGTLIATARTDVLQGDAGANRLYGMGGNDILIVGLGGDELHGGTGTDLIDFSRLELAEGDVSGIELDLSHDNVVRFTAYTLDAPARLLEESQVTFTDIEGVVGSKGADRLTGTAGTDQLYGKDGNDTLRGGEGRDSLAGGHGNDIIFGGTGNDLLLGNTGNDIFYQNFAATDSDYISGGDNGGYSFSYNNAHWDFSDAGINTVDYQTWSDSDYVDADGLGIDADLSQGKVIKKHNDGDFIDWLSDIEILIGTDLDDVIRGNSYTTTLVGGKGNDQIYGHSNAVFHQGFDFETDRFYSTAPKTKLDYSALGDIVDDGDGRGLTVNLKDGYVVKHHNDGDIKDYITGVRNIIATNLDDVLGSNDGYYEIYGMGGNDTLSAGGGTGQLHGGAGNDTFIVTSKGSFTSFGGTGFDVIDLSGLSIHERITGGVEVDLMSEGWVRRQNLMEDHYVIMELAQNGTYIDSSFGKVYGLEGVIGTEKADRLVGSAAGNYMSGEGGDDVISGGGGDDTLHGGTGHDLLTGGSGRDTFEFRTDFGQDQIYDLHVGGARDSIRIEGFSVAAFEELMQLAEETDEGTLIRLDQDNALLLRNVSVEELHEDDFAFC